MSKRDLIRISETDVAPTFVSLCWKNKVACLQTCRLQRVIPGVFARAARYPLYSEALFANRRFDPSPPSSILPLLSSLVSGNKDCHTSQVDKTYHEYKR